MQNGCLVSSCKTGNLVRKLYQMRHGELSKNLNVLHKCDNPACIEDAHHFPGTQKDNVLDMVQKKRHWLQQHPERVAGDLSFAKKPEVRAKMRAAKLGRPVSAEQLEALAKARSSKKGAPRGA